MSDLILGIESSCDDPAVAIVDREGFVLSSVVSAQTDIHAEWGGVYPEFASRAHVSSIIPAVKKALEDASITPERIKAIGVTRGPGLIGSLLVGLNTATGLGLAWNKPVIGINHLRGHLRSADLEDSKVTYPSLILLVSGGHTFLAFLKSPSDVTLLGATRDDSVGEAYDKVARMMDLPYPGGPEIDKLAKIGEATIQFPRPMMRDGLEFSFSGLKSSVSRYLSQNPGVKKEDVAASFVEAVLDILMAKCERALLAHSARSLTIVGGVAASPQLRQRASELCDKLSVELCLPPLRWSTDNAAMIALATFDYLDMDTPPKPLPHLGLPLTEF